MHKTFVTSCIGINMKTSTSSLCSRLLEVQIFVTTQWEFANHTCAWINLKLLSQFWCETLQRIAIIRNSTTVFLNSGPLGAIVLHVLDVSLLWHRVHINGSLPGLCRIEDKLLRIALLPGCRKTSKTSRAVAPDDQSWGTLLYSVDYTNYTNRKLQCSWPERSNSMNKTQTQKPCIWS